MVDVAEAFRPDFNRFMVPLEMETDTVKNLNMRKFFFLDKIGL